MQAVKLCAMAASKRARRTRCKHDVDTLTVSYTLKLEGGFTCVVWCGRCGALGLRQTHPGSEPVTAWRLPER